MMKKPGGFAKIDYRTPAKRLSERARTNKANFLAIGTALTIMVGLAAFLIMRL